LWKSTLGEQRRRRGRGGGRRSRLRKELKGGILWGDNNNKMSKIYIYPMRYAREEHYDVKADVTGRRSGGGSKRIERATLAEHFT